MSFVDAEHVQLARERTDGAQRIANRGIERVAGDDGVEPVLERRLGQRPRDETLQIEAGLGQRRDRRVQRARPVVGDERERNARVRHVDQ